MLSTDSTGGSLAAFLRGASHYTAKKNETDVTDPSAVSCWLRPQSTLNPSLVKNGFLCVIQVLFLHSKSFGASM